MASKAAFLTPRHNPRDLALSRSTEVSTSGMYPRQAFAQYRENLRAVQIGLNGQKPNGFPYGAVELYPPQSRVEQCMLNSFETNTGKINSIVLQVRA